MEHSVSEKQFEINQSIILSLSEFKIQEKLSNQNFSLVFPLLKLTLRTHKQKKKVYKDIKLDYQITGKKKWKHGNHTSFVGKQQVFGKSTMEKKVEQNKTC